ncbi:Dephospho-CoA kinase [Beggiatoa sp. PS]|nr:Dephospho-CoA kinase [Beggiatoa sp. PS]
MDLPLKIGLTGGIASGKTTVSQLFAKLGIPIIDADVIAHQLVEPGQPALNNIRKIFGPEIIDHEGQLNRAKLRQKIFADTEKRQQLEAILHPRIKKIMQTTAAQTQSSSYCILSIPLLLETQQKELVDRILVVDCSPELQHQRLQQRDKLSNEEIERIVNAQASREARLAIADDVIYNNSNFDNLQKQVFTLHNRFLAKVSLTT